MKVRDIVEKSRRAKSWTEFFWCGWDQEGRDAWDSWMRKSNLEEKKVHVNERVFTVWMPAPFFFSERRRSLKSKGCVGYLCEYSMIFSTILRITFTLSKLVNQSFFGLVSGTYLSSFCHCDRGLCCNCLGVQFWINYPGLKLTMVDLNGSLTRLEWLPSLATGAEDSVTTSEPNTGPSTSCLKSLLSSPPLSNGSSGSLTTSFLPKPFSSVRMSSSGLPDDGRFAKPPHSYATLIKKAICSSAQKRMTLSDIYDWIRDNYPYYQTEAKKGWRVSNDLFELPLSWSSLTICVCLPLVAELGTTQPVAQQDV